MKYDGKAKTGKWKRVTLQLAHLLFPVLLLAQNVDTAPQYYNATPKAKKTNTQNQTNNYKQLPYSTFMAFYGGVQGDYVPQRFFDFKTPVFGLKIGTMKNTGWFIGAMTNFNFKGVLNTFNHPESVEKKSYAYFEGFMGLTGRYCKPLSFHFGFGYFYSALNHMKLSNDEWGHWREDVKHGPVLTAGFMFHIRNFVLSVEVSSSYNIAFIRETTSFQSERVGLGAKAGLGFCIPKKKKQGKKTEYKQNRSNEGIGKELRKQVPL
ncbi:MAG: hypothetical protein J5644_10380 [Bacteroidales bacterium]|nr:hypothetical protein [Bacteroidales bacterium]